MLLVLKYFVYQIFKTKQHFEDVYEVKLFGTSFIENNKDNCLMEIQGKNYLINEYYQLGNRTFCNPIHRKNRILSNKMSFFHARHAQCHGIYDTITMSRITVSNNDTVHGV